MKYDKKKIMYEIKNLVYICFDSSVGVNVFLRIAYTKSLI
jgi:hypothetical protein